MAGISALAAFPPLNLHGRDAEQLSAGAEGLELAGRGKSIH
jgi:hypothetical protein